MPSSIRIAALFLLAAAALPAAAVDACRPVRVLPPGTSIRFSAQEFELLPRLQLVAGRPFAVRAEPSLFGLSNPAAAAAATAAHGSSGTRLPQAVTVPPQVMSHDLMGPESARLVFERTVTRAGEGSGAVAGRIHLHAGNRRFVVGVENGDARGTNGNLLKLLPPLASESQFSIGAGAAASALHGGQVQLAAGTRLEWSPSSAAGGLEARLLEATPLEQVAPAESHAQMEILKTARVLPGAPLRVKLTAPGFDFAGKVLAFCFGGVDPALGAKVIAGVGARLVERSGDSAIYDVPVPENLPAALAPREGSGLDRVWGREARLRVIGYDGGDVAMESSGRFTMSNTAAAIVAGVLLVAFAFVGSALFVRRLNPLVVLDELLRRPDGAYSLSNAQILLWTVLVIFALCFVWVGSGQLLSISPGILVLLGISGGSSVLARAIEKSDPPSPPRAGEMADLFRDNEGRFDLLRFQMLGFTLFTWVYSLVSVLRFEGLPEIPENLYLLMGISNAAYLGGKVAPKMMKGSEEPAAAAGEDALSDAERSLTRGVIEKLQQAVGAAPTGRIDAATREAVASYKRQNGITPANGRVNRWLLNKLSLA